MPQQEVLGNVQEATSGSSEAFEKAVEGFRGGELGTRVPACCTHGHIFGDVVDVHKHMP